MDTRDNDDRRDDRGRYNFHFFLKTQTTTSDHSIVRGQQPGNNPGNNLHVSGLSTRVEDRDLEEIFGKFGRVHLSLPISSQHIPTNLI